jgi:hypothetical protein
LGRRGGSVSSPAKVAAVRRNGTFGGRKPKFQIGERARCNEQAPGDYRERIGTITDSGPNKSEYRVEFTDGDQPLHGYLMSWWLDRTP